MPKDMIKGLVGAGKGRWAVVKVEEEESEERLSPVWCQ